MSTRKVSPSRKTSKNSRQALLIAQLRLLLRRAELGLRIGVDSALNFAFLVGEIERER